MPPEVIRLGGVARLDPEPERELDVWRDDLTRGVLDDPDETRDRLEAHARGHATIVELGLFADVLEGAGLRRIDGTRVPGLWFERGRAVENTQHAAEIVADRIDAMRADLERHGVHVETSELARLPIKIELEPAVEAALRDDRARRAS